jgi:transcription initiation factor TFIID subunit 1, fungi type
MVCKHALGLLTARLTYSYLVETWYPRRREIPRNFLEAVVGDTQKRQEDQTAAEAVASGSVDDDLRRALQVRLSCFVRQFLPSDNELERRIYE